jgi:dipeptidyl aminopeptidase/acylaminoacyl peptidase
MGENGEEPRKIMGADEGESLSNVIWSPDGRRLAYERVRFGPAGVRCSLESRETKGGEATVLLSDSKLAPRAGGLGFSWLADGRVIYCLGEADLTDTNLWEIKVDARSGRPVGKPRRITSWSDFVFVGPEATADGRRLVFCRFTDVQTDVYVGDLEPGGARLKRSPRRLTLDERNDNPSAWTPDSKAVLFMSDRTGSYNIYRQDLDQDAAERLVASSQMDLAPRMTPDGKWITYVRFAKPDDIWTSAPSQLMRVPISGGPSALVLTAHGLINQWCARAPATLCIVGEESEDQKHLVFTSFDPLKGRGRELARIATDPGLVYNFGMSPDGSKVAVLFPPGENRIRVLPLQGGAPRDLVANGWWGFYAAPDWSPDGNGFYVGSSSSRGGTLLYMDLKGQVSAVWQQKGIFDTWGDPSPDGRHVAILGEIGNSNVWMVENF